MKDINEVIRRKETQLQQLQRDVESLRVAVLLLSDDANTTMPTMADPDAIADAYVPAVGPAATASNADPWDNVVKKFP